MKNWINNLSPFPPDDFDPAKLLKAAAQFGSAYYWKQALQHAIGGNSITSLLYGGLSDQVGALASAIGPAMGTATSYGRRTATLMSLNLEGKRGLPLALGGSPTVGEAAYCVGIQ